MKYVEVIKHYGTVRKAADALGITTQCVYNWKKKFPVKSQVLVFLETEGALTIDGAPKTKKAAKK